MQQDTATLPDAATLSGWLTDAAARTQELIADLSDDQLMVPRLPTINPLVWESCHAGFFYERFVLQEAGHPVLWPEADGLFNSITIAHETRWDLPVPSRAEALAYQDRVHGRIQELLAAPGGDDARLRWLVTYAVLHEDMHTEAITYCRQTCAYPAPRLFGSAGHPVGPPPAAPGPPPAGDAEFDACIFELGAPRDTAFCFDNEKWAHPVELAPFAISRAPVTQSQFAAFVDDGGYTRKELWSPEGWAWRSGAEAAHPLYWRPDGAGGWERRDFDRWVALEPHRVAIHINWWEADAWCRWAGRRLPAEAEWERAASGLEKRRFPWGNDPGGAAHANLEWGALGCVDAGSCGAGDTPEGCTHMLGDVWEWTADTFGPFAGFTPDHYADYSQPLFGETRVLRGGCWVTRRRLARNGYRNYQGPHRGDIWCGFRTCAASS